MTNSSLRVYQLNKTFQVLVFLLLFFDQSSCYWFDIATMKYSASAMFNSVLPPLMYYVQRDSTPIWHPEKFTLVATVRQLRLCLHE